MIYYTARRSKLAGSGITRVPSAAVRRTSETGPEAAALHRRRLRTPTRISLLSPQPLCPRYRRPIKDDDDDDDCTVVVIYFFFHQISIQSSRRAPRNVFSSGRKPEGLKKFEQSAENRKNAPPNRTIEFDRIRSCIEYMVRSMLY